MKVTIGMPEMLVIGSICLHQYAFAFSITLLVLGLFGKVAAYAIDLQEKKEKEQAGKEAVKNIVDTVSNAMALGDILNNKKDNGFH